MAGRKKLGRVLIDAGIIDEFQLRSALSQQERWGRRLGMNLISLGFLAEENLLTALSEQLGITVAHPRDYEIDTELLELVPRDLAEKYMVFPLGLKGPGNRTLILGMEDPCDLAAVDAIGFRTNLTIETILVAPSELAAAIDRFYYGRSPSEEQEFDEFVLENASNQAAAAPLQEIDPAVAEDAGITGVAARFLEEDTTLQDEPAPAEELLVEEPKADDPSVVPTRKILQALTKILIERNLIEPGELMELARSLHEREVREERVRREGGRD